MTPLDRRTFVVGTTALGAGTLAGYATSASAQNAPARKYTDAMFNKPYIDVDEMRDTPQRHRYVHGGFTGTDAKFIALFPPKEQYQGRFFQYNTPISTTEQSAINGPGDFSGFCFDSGAIALASNQGGLSAVPQTGKDDVDPNIGSFRVQAAAAMYIRQLAQEMYGPHRTYGYAFGGSGGGYRTLACAENCSAWDGVVPYIHGNFYAWPNGYSGRARAQRILKPKMRQIADALEPGGGDPYASLNDEERGVLSEVTKMGFPIRTWVFNDNMGIGPLTLLFQSIQTLDPEYFDIFWKTPGYLGHDHPETFKDVRLQHRTKVKRVIMSDQAAAAGLSPPSMFGRPNADPDQAWRNFQADYGAPLAVALELESIPPPGSFIDMANINILSGAGAGKWTVLGSFSGNFARFQFSPATGSQREVTDLIRAGDEVAIDNSNILAYETYYRHAIMTPDYYVGNQFREGGRPTGKPIYPQRPKLIAFDLMKGSTPKMPTGKFDCKMIVVQNLVDWDAQAWYADFYRNQVRQHLGARFTDQYRLWYTDYATHGGVPDPTRIINYTPVLHQALRDLAAWVEKGIAPPQETSYKVENGQVIVAPTAAQRKGVQAVVSLKANGGIRTDAKVGQPVTFTAVVETPPGTGPIVAAEWAFETGPQVVGSSQNRYTVTEQVTPAPRLTLTRQYIFTKPGTYYPALRVHSQRQGNMTTPYGRIPNLGRVRVVVT